jgi:amino acid transporter
VLLILRHVSAFDFYSWLGTIATFGFVTAYILVVIAAMLKLWKRKQFTLIAGLVGVITLAFLGWAFAGSLNLDATGPERWLAPVYLAVVVGGVLFGIVSRRTRVS